ncbi:PQQ-dependent sugar dehydrogenase [Evansella sp. LMS18]|uniref:PQQ-dependent sugar dehydrogenase n=1 Tax=Evansella sp. LMS18 TaxID=2924033 RepID=UPI0020D17A16|nr:PQQ-dependent sugar dehydrogenase [Evansella sp. LMS18]UTR11497.1 PQQ-dependent sugar dehydrogenase [Evansella sp. LMS18]
MKRSAVSFTAFALLLGACGNNTENESELEQDPSSIEENEENEVIAPTDENDAEELPDENSNTAENDNSLTERESNYTNLSSEDWQTEVLAENLHVPWDINFFEDTIFLTEREGTITAVEDGSSDRQEINTSDPIIHEGEGGLLGMAVSEDFGDTGEIFLYYTYEGSSGLENRVVKAVQEDGSWEETEILLDEIPGDGIHNGGRIVIGPDGYLYVTTGDANEPALSQDPDNLAGSILRLTVEGEVPGDNPFEDSFVFSYGHRNPQGLAWNSNEELYSSEHGPTGHDEINVIEAGNNYGWPEIIGDEEMGEMEQPLVHSGENTWAPSGTAFLEDQLFVTGLRGQNLYVLSEENSELKEVFSGEGRLRDVKVHEGNLYVITNNTDGRGNPDGNDDRLLRLTIKGREE